MKKFILLVFVALFAFILINRQRVFIRDPLGSVTRNGVKEQGTQVYINYSNDVLLENDNPPMYVTLIQRRTPAEIGTPERLNCLHWMACLADGYPAKLAEPAWNITPTQMTSKVVTYTDAENRAVQITLR